MWDPGVKPRPLHWERGDLATGPPGSPVKGLAAGSSISWGPLFLICKMGMTRLTSSEASREDQQVEFYCCYGNWFSSVQSRSHVWLFATPWIAACQASLSITNSWSPPKPMSIASVMPSNHRILYRPLFFLPSIFPSIQVFSNESALRIRWPKYWSFSFKISPSNEHPGLISFRMNWLDLLAVHRTHKSLLQHHSSKASILQHSAFFIVQLSHPYMTTGKTVALTRRTLCWKSNVSAF